MDQKEIDSLLEEMGIDVDKLAELTTHGASSKKIKLAQIRRAKKKKINRKKSKAAQQSREKNRKK